MATTSLLSGYQVSPVVPVLLLGALGGVAIISWSWSRLRHVPGPFLASVSPAWQLYFGMKGDLYLDLKDLADKYGDLIRIGPKEVITGDINVVHRMSAAKSPYVRGPWYGTFRFMKEHDHLFSVVDEKEHTALRSKMSPGYAGTSTMEAGVEAQVSRLIALIERKYLSTDTDYKPVDFATLAHYFAIDVIGEVTFGKSFGFLDNGDDIFGYLKWNNAFFPVFMTAGTLPRLSQMIHKPWFPDVLPKSTDSTGLGRFIKFTKEMVEDRIKVGPTTRRNMMDVWLQQGATFDENLSQSVLSVVAGTDSTATAIRMTMLYLINTPIAYSKLRDEIDTAAAAGLISAPIKDAEAKKLPYLQAVFREGLRIFPGATPLLFKQVPAGGDTVCGHYLPAGTQLGTNVYGILRSKKYWGDDADVFRPERWLGVSEKRLEEMNSIFEVQFGFGKYKCLGRPLTFLELSKAIPELLRRFDFTVVNAPSPLKIVNAGFFSMEGLTTRITKR